MDMFMVSFFRFGRRATKYDCANVTSGGVMNMSAVTSGQNQRLRDVAESLQSRLLPHRGQGRAAHPLDGLGERPPGTIT